ncbi:MAG: Panacea domain-containing protein [Pyrinomonadaceae bacterium]
MNKNDLVLNLSARSIDGVVGDVRQFLKNERGLEVPDNLIREGMAGVLYSKLDLLAEDLREMFTSPQRDEVKELERILARASGAVRIPMKMEAAQTVEQSMFSGQRAFSAEKLGAMMEYILSKGRTVYKTNLNKLLFYSDLTAFYLRGAGMSGAVYLNRPYGPVADPAAEVLDDLIQAGRVTIAERTKHFITAGESVELLDEDEIKVLDWVLDTYGEMGAGEISELSHAERAYKDTKANEPIAYAYAQFLQKLPEKTLLD